MAAGFGVILPVSTLGPYCVTHWYGHGVYHNDNSVRDGYRILISTVGGHAPHQKVEGLVLSVLIIT